MKQTSFSPEESFKLINQMIGDARQSYEHNSFYFLLWGWLLFFTGISIFVLNMYNWEYAPFLWFVQGVVGGIASSVYSRRQHKKARENKIASSPVNKTILNVWLAFGITLFFIIYSSVYYRADTVPFVLLVTAFPTFVSGRVLRFKPLIVGGICFWILGITALYIGHSYSLLIFSFAILVGYLVPGYLLRIHEKQKISVQGA